MPATTQHSINYLRSDPAMGDMHEANWENEGGQLSGHSRLAPSHVPADQARMIERDQLQGSLERMARNVANDFANGLTGTRFNTYQHRSRAIRQQVARLQAMRVGNASSAGNIAPDA